MQVDSKIYVAGHTGLVGSAILRALKNNGYKNIITKDFQALDLRSQAQVEYFFQENRPEYVFLAAARVGGIWANSMQKADFIYDNLMISTNVIHAAYEFGVKKLLNLGSSCIYPKNALQPLKEEYLLSGSLEETNEAYAIAKIAALKLCRYFNEQYGTNFISVMPTNLYGPNDNFNLETAHVLPAMIRKFHLAKLLANKDFKNIRLDLKRFGGYDRMILRQSQDDPSIQFASQITPSLRPLLATAGTQDERCQSPARGECARSARIDASAIALQERRLEPSPLGRRAESNLAEIESISDLEIQDLLAKFGITAQALSLWGTGEVYREFLHVDDLAQVLIFLINNCDYKDLGECINIGVGMDLKISELAQIIKNAVRFTGAIKFDHASSDGTPRKLLDVSRISKLGWSAKISLESGIKNTYEWYCSANQQMELKKRERVIEC
jgi:GDP-L-fucose synthase